MLSNLFLFGAVVAEAINCGSGSGDHEVALEINYFLDMGAWGNLDNQRMIRVRQDYMALMKSLGDVYGNGTRNFWYAYSNGPGTHCGSSWLANRDKFLGPEDALEATERFFDFHGSVDTVWDRHDKEYSSLTTVLRHSFQSPGWTRGRRDAQGRKVVRILHIATDVVTAFGTLQNSNVSHGNVNQCRNDLELVAKSEFVSDALEFPADSSFVILASENLYDPTFDVVRWYQEEFFISFVPGHHGIAYHMEESGAHLDLSLKLIKDQICGTLAAWDSNRPSRPTKQPSTTTTTTMITTTTTPDTFTPTTTPGLVATTTTPGLVATTTNPDFDATTTNPDFDATSTNPDFDATSTNPDFDATSTNPDATTTTPGLVATSTTPDLVATTTTPGLVATSTNPDATTTTPDLVATTTTPDLVATTTTPDLVATTTTPDLVATTTTPDLVATTTTPDATSTTPDLVATTTTPDLVATTTTPGLVATTTTPDLVATTTTPDLVATTISTSRLTRPHLGHTRPDLGRTPSVEATQPAYGCTLQLAALVALLK